PGTNIPIISINLLNITNSNIIANISVYSNSSIITSVNVSDNGNNINSTNPNSNYFSKILPLPYSSYTNLTVCASTNAGTSNCYTQIIQNLATTTLYGLIQMQAYLVPVNQNIKLHPIGNTFNLNLGSGEFQLILNITNIGNTTINNINLILNYPSNNPEIIYNGLSINNINSINIPSLQPGNSSIITFSLIPLYVGSSNLQIGVNVNNNYIGNAQYNFLVNYPTSSSSLVVSQDIYYPLLALALSLGLLILS
ncbi:MAG: hypothetical protein ACP5GJ_02030, partial [Nanopusillaceae archaeon]